MQNNIVPSVVYAECFDQVRYAECCYAECRYNICHGQGDQIGRNFAIWAIFYGVGRIYILEKVAQ